MQWLVGWFGDQGKKGVCVGKRVHCGPVHGQEQIAFLLKIRLQLDCLVRQSLRGLRYPL